MNMSLNISDKTVSLIVQNYLSSLVLITKTFIGDTIISDLKKKKFVKLGVLTAEATG